MRKVSLSLFLIGCFVVFGAGVARAEILSFSFGDSSYYWPGWNNGTGDDTKDTIGTPNFIGGKAVIENGLLTDLVFDRTAGTSLYSLLSPGDLFIDFDTYMQYTYMHGKQRQA